MYKCVPIRCVEINVLSEVTSQSLSFLFFFRGVTNMWTSGAAALDDSASAENCHLRLYQESQSNKAQFTYLLQHSSASPKPNAAVKKQTQQRGGPFIILIMLLLFHFPAESQQRNWWKRLSGRVWKHPGDSSAGTKGLYEGSSFY